MGLAESLRETYQRAAKEVDKKLKSFTAHHLAKAERLRKQVQEGKISEEEYQRWLQGQVFIGKRWKEKLDDITQTYVDADKKARKIINGTNKNEFVRFANIQGNDIKNHVAGYSFDVYDKHTVERLLKEDPKMLPEWKINEKKDYTWNEKRVKNEIMQGIIQGEDIPKIAKRLTVGLAADNDKKMMLFARTAITGAQNAGRMERLHEAKGMGVQVKKKWLATLDKRTRDAHAELDGQEKEIDEPFEVMVDGKLQKIDYPGDPNADPAMTYNCRCTLIYVYPQYRDLQKNDERREQTTLEGEKSGKVIENQTYGVWQAVRETQAGGHVTDKSISRIWSGRNRKREDFATEILMRDTGVSKEKAEEYLDVVQAYSGSEYVRIRRYQQKKISDPDVIDYIAPREKAIEEFIGKATKWTGGMTYRAIGLTDEELADIIKKVEQKKQIPMRGTASWSSNEKVAKDHDIKEKPNRVIFVCPTQKQGATIRTYSESPHEWEVLVSKKARYKPISYKVVDGITYVYLEEE